jgi:hypothetical protein
VQRKENKKMDLSKKEGIIVIEILKLHQIEKAGTEVSSKEI